MQLHLLHGRQYCSMRVGIKGKVLPYSLPSISLGADPIPVYRQSADRWPNHLPGGMLPLLSVRPVVTFVAFTRWRQLHTSDSSVILIYWLRKDERLSCLVGWPVADCLPTRVVTHQRLVQHGVVKICWSETDVLPLCHATNQEGRPPQYFAKGIRPVHYRASSNVKNTKNWQL